MNGLLVGIISFGPTVCGFPDAPTVFSLVGAYADWIETVNETVRWRNLNIGLGCYIILVISNVG